MYKMAREKFQDIYIFLAFYIRSKTKNENLLSNKKICQVQDRRAVTRPRLLYYTKDISTIVLSNICTSISVVNRVRYLVVGIVLDNNNIGLIFSKFIINLTIMINYFQIDSNTILYSLFPKAVLLLHQFICLKLILSKLNQFFIPIVSINFSILINKVRLI